MNETCFEGIVLHALDYKDSQKIVTLFTPAIGKVSFIIKRLSKKASDRLLFATPLTRAEFVLKPSKGELFTFIDGSILDLQLELRSAFFRLHRAMKILDTLLFSQMPGKPSPLLYTLSLSYLKKLASLSEETISDVIWASFLLKVLKHEGLFPLDTSLKSSFLLTEEKLLMTLAEARSFSELSSLSLSKEFVLEIETFFRQQIQHL